MAQRSYLQDILSVFGSNVAVTIGSLLVGIILSRILGAAGYGEYSSIIVVPMIVIGLTQLGIRRSTMYHLSAGKDSEDHIVSAVFILLLLTSFLTILISGLVFLFSESKFNPVNLTIIMLTIPFVAYGLLRYLFLMHSRHAGGNPEEVLLGDPALAIDLGLWAVVVVVVLYST